ncbi:VOC family protein [Sphingomonas xanthus]|uniref:Glyoxalase n=1 Tax=Sphingomonas xanthus TaxID=2594473 RepID=A0A516ISX6_9SPHN|nr:VOC family protein [Sphingomonas xanthus]QDP20011.1 glyoxalase [Sphingomonas xanthus]
MKLDHVVIMVRSLDQSLPWYSTILPLLGFDKTRDHVWYDGGVAIDLKKARSGTADYERYGPGLNHLGFTAPNEAALDRVREAMAVAGFEVPDKQRLGTEIATFFKDPDGMRLELTVYG